MYNFNNTSKVVCKIQLCIFTITLKGKETEISALSINIDRPKFNIVKSVVYKYAGISSLYLLTKILPLGPVSQKGLNVGLS